MIKNFLKITTDEHRWTRIFGSSEVAISLLTRLRRGNKHKLENPITIRVNPCSIHPALCAQRLRMVNFFVLFLLLNVSVFSQTTEKEKTNIEIMQENEAIIEKDRASREKEPLTGYDAETNSKKSIKENNAKYSNFWVVGGSIGSPASGNINVGYYFENFVLRLSGMRYSQHWNGIQGDIGYSFWKTSVVAHSVSLVFGTMNVRPFDPQTQQGGQNKYERDGIPGYTNQPQTFTDTLIRGYIAEQDPTLATLLEYQYRTRQYANFRQQYVGLTYDFLLGGFFLQLGMGFGSGTYRDPQLLLQMGYLLDFGRKAD